MPKPPPRKPKKKANPLKMAKVENIDYKDAALPVSYTHLTLPTNREV